MERRAAGRATQLPLRLHEGNLISLPERRRATRCLWCCNIIESAPLGRATRRRRGRGGRGVASRQSRKGQAGGAEAPWAVFPDKAPRSPAPVLRPRPSQSFVPTSSPGATPAHFRGRRPHCAEGARARNRESGFGSAARPALPVPHTRRTRFWPLAPLPSPQTWVGGERVDPRRPPPSRSPFMPGPRCSAAPDTCRSHRRPGLSELLISPGAARRRARPLGGGASGAWAKKHLLLSPPRTHPSATPPTPRPRLAPGALTSAGGRCRVSAASARARTDGPPGAPSAVTARRVGAAPALLATPAGLSGDLGGLGATHLPE